MTTEPILIIELNQADPRKRGQAYGEAARNRIHAILDKYREIFQCITGETWQTTLERGESFIPKAQAFAPDLVEEAWTYHREVTTKDYTWESLLPAGTEPPIHLNAEKMKGYRPLLEPLKYDPTRFDTYLEQLGITYPVLSKPAGTGQGR